MSPKQYVEYLIATPGNYTCTNLADHLGGDAAVSHDAVSDFLARGRVTPRTLWEAVAPLLHDGPDAYLVVDDTVLDKRYSRKIGLVRKQYSGAAGGLVDGIGVVNLLHSDGGEFHPIDFRIFAPEQDGKTKHDHFLEMLRSAVADKGVKARTVLFDSWYASAESLKAVHRMGLAFVTALKSNRLVSVSREAGYVHLEDLVWDERSLRDGLPVRIKEVPFPVRLFKLVAENGGIDWAITNRGAGPGGPGPITAQDVQRENAVRWQIERLHREMKQLVGLEKCQCRKARSQRNHIGLCYLAWLSLKVHARALATTLYDARRRLTKGYLVQQLATPTIQAYAY